MTSTERTETLLATAQRTWVAGAKPARERRAAQWLGHALRQGLVGVVLVAAMATATAGRGPDVPALPHDRTDAVAMATAQLVPTAIDRRAKDLPWVLPSGQVDGGRLLDFWKEGGVTPEQAAQLLNVLVITQSPVVTQTDAARQRVERQVARTAGILDVRTREQAAAFLTAHGTDALAWQGILHSSEAVNNDPGERFTWPDVLNYWHRLSPDRLDEANSEPRTTGWGIDPQAQDMASARADLVAAVAESGLASLRVPLPAWNDAANVRNVAQRVRESNALLQQVTGWEGPVLGLGGRVEWTVYNPLNLGATFHRSAQETIVLSGWEDLPHEWFHALDYALRTAPVDLDASGGATLTQQWDAHSHGTDVDRTWGTLHDRLRNRATELGHAWYLDRDDRIARLKASHDDDDHWRARYLQHRHETIAFAWQAYFQTHLGANAASWTREANNGQMGPIDSEAEAMAPVWTALFQDLKAGWWATQHAVTPTLDTWRQGRRALATAVAPPKSAAPRP